MVFSRALHRKKKIATVLKLTKLKMKRSNELRKFTPKPRGERTATENFRCRCLSSRKQNQKSLMMEGGGGGGGATTTPLRPRVKTGQEN